MKKKYWSRNHAKSFARDCAVFFSKNQMSLK
jgi:hypothetical protein